MAKRPKKPKFDPIKILRSIAEDKEAGSTARVQAAKFLAQHKLDDDTEKSKDGAPTDQITQRALRLLKGGKS